MCHQPDNKKKGQCFILCTLCDVTKRNDSYIIALSGHWPHPQPGIGSALHLVNVTFQTCGSSNKGSVLTCGCKQRAKQSHFEFGVLRWLIASGCSKGVWRPSRVFMCLREPMGNAAVGQSSKHSQHGYVDTLYLMDRPLRKHSLEQAAEKCLTHIGGMLLTGDVCKQQPSPCVVVGVRCERPSGPYRMGVVRENKVALQPRFWNFQKTSFNLPSYRKSPFILLSITAGKRYVYHMSEQLLTPTTQE